MWEGLRFRNVCTNNAASSLGLWDEHGPMQEICEESVYVK